MKKVYLTNCTGVQHLNITFDQHNGGEPIVNADGYESSTRETPRGTVITVKGQYRPDVNDTSSGINNFMGSNNNYENTNMAIGGVYNGDLIQVNASSGKNIVNGLTPKIPQLYLGPDHTLILAQNVIKNITLFGNIPASIEGITHSQGELEIQANPGLLVLLNKIYLSQNASVILRDLNLKLALLSADNSSKVTIENGTLEGLTHAVSPTIELLGNSKLELFNVITPDKLVINIKGERPADSMVGSIFLADDEQENQISINPNRGLFQIT